MAIRLGYKAATLSLTLSVLMSGVSSSQSLNVAWAAEPTISPASPGVVEPSFSENGISDSDKKAISGETKQELMPYIWGIIAIFGLWNAGLTFVAFRTIKYYGEKLEKNNSRSKALEERDIALDQRISRKSALIDELSGKLASYKKALESVQSQIQSRVSDRYSFESSNNPVKYIDNDPYVSQELKYTPQERNFSQPASVLREPWDKIVQNYNFSPQGLEREIIERVSESDESLNSRRGNSKAAVFLKSASNYSYLVFAGEDQNYWLTPKSDLKITPMGFDTFQALFECPEYHQGSKIQMIKPAKVAQNSYSGGWDLVEKGCVQFT